MLLFGLGNLVYVIVLIINAIAVLSEDRFLARIGWGRTQAEPSFGASYDSTSVKAKSVNLIASVRTVMRIPLIVINTVIIVYELILG
ncbi:Yos1 family protein [Penicillium ucsense]|uniref:Yos1 family protein n=1 Tax=Penicillium ucsense TaxID=2839758 RepID=A0A8J8WGB6_9EURO|nr:Yos1 family protein [Penicillium ucsense]KAF7733240.1 Yos1 family protein [Penicillium ucsense]